MSELHPAEPDSPVPGCGLAAYAALLGAICLIGLIGLGSATGVMLTAPRVLNTALTSGTLVSVAQLKPMRDAGVLQVDEVPAAYHDETRSRDGTVACALTEDRIIRVANGKSWQLPYAAIENVVADGDESQGMIVTASGQVENEPLILACSFGAREGGVRFYRQVQTEQLRHHR